MRATLVSVALQPGHTIALATAVNDHGEHVTFAGDWRPLRDLKGQLELGEDIPVEIEPWQILKVERKEPASW